MANDSITSANAILTLTVPGLFAAPEQIRGFAVDDAWATESLSLAEVQMGVDGRMTAGYTPNPTKMKITIQADSPSRRIFETITAAMKSQQEIYYLNGDLTAKSIGKRAAMTRGVLTATQQMPDGGKTLKPVQYEITWERMDVSSL